MTCPKPKAVKWRMTFRGPDQSQRIMIWRYIRIDGVIADIEVLFSIA